jgi:hypothetical protein
MAITAVSTDKNHFEDRVANDLESRIAPVAPASCNFIDLIIRVCGLLSTMFSRLSLANNDKKRVYENRFEILSQEHAHEIGKDGWVKGLAGLATVVSGVAIFCLVDKKYQKVARLFSGQIQTVAGVYSSVSIQQLVTELQNKESLLLSKIQHSEDLDKNAMQEILDLLKTVLRLLLESAGPGR